MPRTVRAARSAVQKKAAAKKAAPTKRAAKKVAPAAKKTAAKKTGRPAGGPRNYPALLSKPATPAQVHLAEWILEKTGYDPASGKTKMAVFMEAVRLAKALVMDHQASDEAKELREQLAEERQEKAREKAAAPKRRGRPKKAAAPVEEEPEEDEEEEPEEDEEDLEEYEEAEEEDEEDEEPEPAPKRRRGRPRKAAPETAPF